MKVTKALVIADPWIAYILDGSKTWEMRSSNAAHRGWLGLIRKGSGAVYGIARLADVGAPLSASEMLATLAYHCIPKEMIQAGTVAHWNTPWKFADIRPLGRPVPYQHKKGAVTWVNLDPEVSDAIARELGAESSTAAASESEDRFDVGNVVLRLTAASHRESESVVGTGSLVGKTTLSQGNLRNSHIYLRPFFDRFPSDAVGGSNRHEKAERELTIDWGGASLVCTDLDGDKRIFRARPWVKEFFASTAACVGDIVLVEETAPYCYRVRLRKEDGYAS